MKVARLTCPIELAAADQGKRRTFSGIAYSGGRADPGYPVVVDLATTRVVPRVPVLFQHRHDETIGVGALENLGSSMTASGELFTDLEDRARSLAAKADAGLPLQLSIGVFGVTEQYVAEGQTTRVNNQDFTGPLYVLSGGLVREVSFVTLGADAATSAHVFELPNGDAGASPLASTLTHEKGSPPMDLAQLQAQVADLNAKLNDRETAVTTLTAERDEARTKLAELEAKIAADAKMAREADVRETLSAVGIDPTDEAIAAYVGLSADAWGRVKTDLGAMRENAPSHLFGEEATDDQARPTGGENPLIADARRRAKLAAEQAAQ